MRSYEYFEGIFLQVIKKFDRIYYIFMHKKMVLVLEYI